MIFFSEILDKKSKLRNVCEKSKNVACIPCYKDNSQTLEIIIRNELNKENIKYSNETVSYLISTSSGDRNYLYSELDKIKSINNEGWIKSLRRGDTGVGYTLETKLGIKANSKKKPDYKGIEIKPITLAP